MIFSADSIWAVTPTHTHRDALSIDCCCTEEEEEEEDIVSPGCLTVLRQQDGSACHRLQGHPDGGALRLQRQQRLEDGQQLEGRRKAADLRTRKGVCSTSQTTHKGKRPRSPRRANRRRVPTDLVEEQGEHLQVITHVDAPVELQQLLLIFSHCLFKRFTLNNQVLILQLPAH